MSDKIKITTVILIFLFSLLAFKVAINEIWISYFSSKLVVFSMDEIKKNGIGFNRYIQINEAILDGIYIFQYETSRFADESSPNSNVRYILLPLYGEKDIPTLMNNEKPVVAVLLKYNMSGGTSNRNIDEWITKNHPPPGEKFSISGVTNMELDSINSEARNKFESSGYKISPKPIILEPAVKPHPVEFGFIVLAIAIVALLISIFSAYKLYKSYKLGILFGDSKTPLNLGN